MATRTGSAGETVVRLMARQLSASSWSMTSWLASVGEPAAVMSIRRTVHSRRIIGAGTPGVTRMGGVPGAGALVGAGAGGAGAGAGAGGEAGAGGASAAVRVPMPMLHSSRAQGTRVERSSGRAKEVAGMRDEGSGSYADASPTSGVGQ